MKAPNSKPVGAAAEPVEAPAPITKGQFKIIGIDMTKGEGIARPRIGYWKDAWRRLKENKVATISLFVLLVLVIMVIIGPYLDGFNYWDVNNDLVNHAPNSAHWFGTDALGRDLFSRVWQAGRVSVAIGLAGACIATVVGCIYGGIAAYFGGAVDTIMMRIVEILYGVPYLLIVILISVVTGSRNIGTLLLALCITGWCDTARLVRGQMLQLKSQEFVLAANALGVSPWKTIIRHLIPNTLSVIIVAITFDIPGFIFAEAFLSYLGLGIKAPNTSWGALCSSAQQVFMFYPYQMFFPALMIALTMLCFTLLGDGLRDALDPKLRK